LIPIVTISNLLWESNRTGAGGKSRIRKYDYRSADPHKLDVLEFSAGRHLAADISTHFDKRLYSGVDAADKINCRLDFAVVLYPGHLWIYKERFELNPNIPIRRQTPPTFLLHAENDPVENAGVPKRCTNTRKGSTPLGCVPRVSDNAVASKWCKRG
jgi:hypothetical protein